MTDMQTLSHMIVTYKLDEISAFTEHLLDSGFSPEEIMQEGILLPPMISENGRAFLAARTGRFAVWDVIGRTVVIHSRTDDFHSQPAGNAGAKIGCGEIKAY